MFVLSHFSQLYFLFFIFYFYEKHTHTHKKQTVSESLTEINNKQKKLVLIAFMTFTISTRYYRALKTNVKIIIIQGW